MAPAKFQSVMEGFNHPTLVGNYQILYWNIFALLILWMIYYLSVLRSVWGMRVIVVTYCFDAYSSSWFEQV